MDTYVGFQGTLAVLQIVVDESAAPNADRQWW